MNVIYEKITERKNLCPIRYYLKNKRIMAVVKLVLVELDRGVWSVLQKDEERDMRKKSAIRDENSEIFMEDENKFHCP